MIKCIGGCLRTALNPINPFTGGHSQPTFLASLPHSVWKNFSREKAAGGETETQLSGHRDGCTACDSGSWAPHRDQQQQASACKVVEVDKLTRTWAHPRRRWAAQERLRVALDTVSWWSWLRIFPRQETGSSATPLRSLYNAFSNSFLH